MAAKSNEIPAVRALLAAFTDLTGAVVTIDALHTQTDTAQAIIARGADYVRTVKRNNPTLYERLKELPWKDVPATSSVTTGRGRRTRRTIKVALVPAWISFAGAAQIAQVRRTVTKKGKKTVEVVYLITSDKMVDPATLAAWNRGHWEIENKLHWVRDVTYQEDKSLVRTGNAPPSDGHSAQPRDQPDPTRRPHQHRRCQPPPRPRPATNAHAASNRMNDFAASLVREADAGASFLVRRRALLKMKSSGNDSSSIERSWPAESWTPTTVTAGARAVRVATHNAAGERSSLPLPLPRFRAGVATRHQSDRGTASQAVASWAAMGLEAIVVQHFTVARIAERLGRSRGRPPTMPSGPKASAS